MYVKHVRMTRGGQDGADEGRGGKEEEGEDDLAISLQISHQDLVTLLSGVVNMKVLRK